MSLLAAATMVASAPRQEASAKDAKRPSPPPASPTSQKKRHKSRGAGSPRGGVSVDAIIAKINRDLAARAAAGSEPLETSANAKRESAKGKALLYPPAAAPAGAARKGKIPNAESAAAKEKKRDAGARAAPSLLGSAAALPGKNKTDGEIFGDGDGHGVGPPSTAYHARTAMPMAREPGSGVGPTRDSDDEEDALQWAREDYRRLVDFDDIKADEKTFMHEWNAFVKQFRPVGDRALPAALEAFAHYRGEAMSKSRTFKRLFALHLLNAFEFGVTPAGTIDTCMKIVESYGSGKGKARRAVPGIGGAIGIPGIGDAGTR